MTLIDMAVSLVKRYEGFRARPYLCPAGVWTIGYGTTVYPDGRSVEARDPALTQDEADVLLRVTLERFWAGIEPYLKRKPLVHQAAAMLSLAYNIGVTAFAKSTLLKKFNAGDDAGAANEFLRWNRAGGKVLDGLTARRARERALFMGGNT